MSIFTAMRDFLRRRLAPPPSTLRNKPGGMAWIKPYGHDFGAHVLAGHVVRTMYVTDGNKWEIDPPQPYTITADCTYSGVPLRAGMSVLAIAIADELLEPIRNPGIVEQDESLRYLPPVPAGEPRKVAA